MKLLLLLLYPSLTGVMAILVLEPGNEDVKSAPVLLDRELTQNTVLKDEPEGKVGVKPEGEVKVEPEAELKVAAKTKAETELGLIEEPEFKVKSEVKVELDVLDKLEPLEEPESNEPQGVQVKLHLEAPVAGQKLEAKWGHMEKTVLEDPVFDQEKEDDDGLLEQEQGKAEDVSEMRAKPFEPVEESSEKYEGLPESSVHESGEDGPTLVRMAEKIGSLEEYFPMEEARVNQPQVQKRNSGPVEKPAMAAMMDEDGEAATATRTQYCPGVILDGKCYQFFKEPLRAESAEFFCQERFPGGHLASITSAIVHRELMKLIHRQNGGYTRTWIGGLRYLQTNRFIWLDGSQWQYADWLTGEPNHTAGLENCVELLPWGNGKFNDFTCWEPQAFICSYRYQ